MLVSDFTLAVSFTLASGKYEFVDGGTSYTYDDLFGFDDSKTKYTDNMLVYYLPNTLDLTTKKGKEFFKNVKFVPLNSFLSESVLMLFDNSKDICEFLIDDYILASGVSDDELKYLLNEGCIIYGEVFIFNNSAYLYAQYQPEEYRGEVKYDQRLEIYNFLWEDKEKVGVYRLDGFDVKSLKGHLWGTSSNAFKSNPWWWCNITSSLAKFLILALFILRFILLYKLCDKLFFKKSKGEKKAKRNLH